MEAGRQTGRVVYLPALKGYADFMDAVWTFMQDHTLEAALAAILISLISLAHTAMRKN